MTFEPIAIVGRSCVLPGALSPEQLWSAVRAGQDLVSSAPSERWRVERDDVASTPGADSADRTYSDRGGYVRGFEQVWQPEGFGVPATSLAGLDAGFQWALHCAREALRDAGDHREGRIDRGRVSAVYGNLGFPAGEMTRYAEAVWTGAPRPDARNRFMSGGNAALLREALGLSEETFCIDTACASSLYAIKLACDQLRDGTSDLVLAGAVNRSDDLFIHVGFSALKALSQSGQSRPFHADADGLLPAEGAGFLALKRLSDAERDGDQIHGVIRGVGLSNDGRGRGFLAPLQNGQERAIRAAYEMSGVNPADVSLLECHATGTKVGDAVEIASSAAVFAGCNDVPIGSLKSNCGHLITAAGVAGVIKVLEAMRHGVRPPTLHADEPNSSLDGSPFRLLRDEEPWQSDGPRIAGVSAFGFGGNNAHCLVEEYSSGRTWPASTQKAAQTTFAIVGVGAVVGSASNAAELVAAARGTTPVTPKTGGFELGLKGLKFPPTDLKETLPQQLLVLKTALEATASASLPSERSGVFLGMEPDPEVCRYGARWRMGQIVRDAGLDPGEHPDWVARNRDAVIATLTSAGVVGTMPNIPANRLNSQFDFGGASVTVSAGERSGLLALRLAMRALETGELDAALVCAVDLSCNEVHEHALHDLNDHNIASGDAAVTAVIKRLDDAQRAGEQVLATFTLKTLENVQNADAVFGRSWAAGDLRDFLAATLPSDLPSVSIDGPTLRFEAHAPPVRIEALPARAHQAPDSMMQEMKPAPRLPSVGSVEPTPVVTHVAAPTAETPAAQTPVTAVIENTPMVGDPKLAALRQALEEVGKLQRSFLADQGAIFQQFMNVQSFGMQTLEAVQGHGGFDAQAPSMPVQHAPAPVAPIAPPRVAAPALSVATPAPRPAPKVERAASPKPAPPKPVAPAPIIETKAAPRQPVGPTFTREQLEIHASGKISEIYGPMFEVQDDYHRQVRMPEPPLLLADRVTGIDAEPGSMKTGTLWSESDITTDKWYLHNAHIPAGIMIESGQADLMLISYLGVDFTNRGERVYRLLGCELTYHGGLPTVGDTMKYDIHLDGHAAQGATRLMFFHYDCRVDGEVRLAVRKGQAGFFTDQELAESEGCLWKPETQELVPNPRLDDPFVECTRTSFSAAEVRAFADGRPWDCFGEAFDWAKTHTRTPAIQNGQMMLLGDIDVFETSGGPWGRGYLKSTVEIAPENWFFDGHFKNDPCMPGTLMFEGCLQAMSFYLAGLGYTLERDGWRFEPVEGEPFQLQCRGQVTPTSKVLTYEMYVEEVIAGPEPTVYADMLCTVDGLKAFHARRVGLRLVPGWPLDEGSKLLDGYEETKAVAKAGDFPFDYRSMLACANGRPSEAFGPVYDRFDSPIRVARLPNPPYHFLSRVTRVVGEIGSMTKGMEVDVEYDIPEDAFYFDENGCRAMPFAVLLEAALQPCGWLASYLGCALTVEQELFFRNLDGTGALHVDLLPSSGTLLTKVKSTNISKTGPMIIVSFEVECLIDGELVYDMTTVFGFFPAEALQNQIGLPTSDEQRALLEAPSDEVIDLTKRPAGYWEADRPKLAEPMLLMLDRVPYFDRTGGEAGLGTLRGEKDVDPGEWFFKAHFFQDPVQPGSLGIEAMIQLLQFYMLETGMDEGVENPRFETLSHAHPMTWKYRGQVVPKNKLISSTLEITEVGRDEDGPFAVGKASLWVDGKRIYEAFNIGMRIVSGGLDPDPTKTLDPKVDTWIGDHRPTYTVPALPMMSIVDLLAQGGCSADPVTALKDVRIKGWVRFEDDAARTVRTERNGDVVRLLEVHDDGAETEVASARVLTGCFGMRPTPLPRLQGAELESPYENGKLFHGPAFQVLKSLVRTAEGASSVLQAAGGVPVGRVNPLLLDGATHGIPHDDLSQWGSKYPAHKVAYPALIPEIAFYGPTPVKGDVRCEVRPDGFLGTPEFPAFKVQLIHDGDVWCEMRLVEACFPKGALGSAAAEDRRAFLRDGVYIDGLRISAQDGDSTTLGDRDVEAIDWLEGTARAVYGAQATEAIAEKEHIAAAHDLHPGIIPDALPLTRFELETTREEDRVTVTGDAKGTLDISPVRDFWTGWFDREPWPVEDLYYGLIERFIGRVVVEDPAGFDAIHGRSALYLANHQVGVESLLFSVIAAGLTEVPTVTLAKMEHKSTWLGQLIEHCFQYPGVRDPRVITFFDREDRESLPRIIGELAQEMAGPGRSVMVHIEGTRSLTCRTPVQKMSGAFIDMALAVNAPIVPVRFVGALPVEPLEKRLEFPVGMGRQDIHFGRPLLPEELAAMHYGDRKKLVIDSINALGPDNAVEEPIPGDADFASRVDEWMAARGVSHEHATLHEVLAERASVVPEVRRLLDASSAADIDANESAETAWLAELAKRLLGDA